jgi:hypothetical protein
MSMQSRETLSKTWFVPGLIGLAVGLALAGGALALSIQQRGLARAVVPAATAAPLPLTATSTPVPPATPTRIPSPSPTHLPALPPTPLAVDSDLRKVEAQIGSADKAALRADLLALLATKSDPEDVARIFTDLGDVEIQLQHIHLASGYFEQAYALQKTPANLIKLADADTYSGKYDQARMRYMELLSWPGAEADPYKETAKAGLDVVNTLLTPGAY